MTRLYFFFDNIPSHFLTVKFTSLKYQKYTQQEGWDETRWNLSPRIFSPSWAEQKLNQKIEDQSELYVFFFFFVHEDSTKAAGCCIFFFKLAYEPHGPTEAWPEPRLCELEPWVSRLGFVSSQATSYPSWWANLSSLPWALK